MKNNWANRGDVFWFDLNPKVNKYNFPTITVNGKSYADCQEYGRRPWLVVSPNSQNRRGEVCMIAPMSTAKRYDKDPAHVGVTFNGNDSFVLCDRITTVNCCQLTHRAGTLPPYEMARVAKAIENLLGVNSNEGSTTNYFTNGDLGELHFILNQFVQDKVLEALEQRGLAGDFTDTGKTLSNLGMAPGSWVPDGQHSEANAIARPEPTEASEPEPREAAEEQPAEEIPADYDLTEGNVEDTGSEAVDYELSEEYVKMLKGKGWNVSTEASGKQKMPQKKKQKYKKRRSNNSKQRERVAEETNKRVLEQVRGSLDIEQGNVPLKPENPRERWSDAQMKKYLEACDTLPMEEVCRLYGLQRAGYYSALYRCRRRFGIEVPDQRRKGNG